MPDKHILFLGDICSAIGRQAVIENLAKIKVQEKIDFTIAQAENAASGYGLTPRLAQELFAAGIDCITLGDHFLDRKEIVDLLESDPRILRPANFPKEVPGRGSAVYQNESLTIGVISLLGRIFLRPVNCPFICADEEIKALRAQTPVIIVDFHAEATAEKQALGWYLDGKVSAVLGTHTHVQTADERILPNGTAYITDVGMCGAMDSVLGMRIDLSVKRIIYNIPLHLEAATDNVHLNGVIVTIDSETLKTKSIRRFDYKIIPEISANNKESINYQYKSNNNETVV
ncbi:MAG: TIGR00282 family metallophosphoesterase [candidate division WOR-3 bacterium]|nr:TIGR00282 family metallophosphoesterase [candidate division WOR-3 bacterium]MDW7988320.1 TIGR00282 family metallophosphoesterase [candidate division WOR-3 bacterium]